MSSLAEKNQPLLRMALVQDTDVVLCRNRARMIAEALRFEKSQQVRIATAVSEIARNAYRYARNATASFGIVTCYPPDRAQAQSLMISVSDSGPGIADLDAVLAGTYRSTSGMGTGIRGAKRLMDRMEISSTPEGTVVRLYQGLRSDRAVDLKELQAVVGELEQGAQANPIEELAVQNQELIVTLEQSTQQGVELREINDELRETNRGVVALYDELETVHRVGRVVASKLDLDSLLSAITDATTELSGAEFGAFFLQLNVGESLVCEAMSGSILPPSAIVAPIGAAALAPAGDQDVFRYDDVSAGDPLYPLAREFSLRSALSCAVRDNEGMLVGALVLGHSDPNVFSERTDRILSTVSMQASVGIANARLYRNVQTANDAKARFLAILSHELRTPLNPVFAILTSFEENPAMPGSLREDLAMMRRNLELEARLIDDLLDLTRISEGKMQFKSETCDMHSLIKAVIQTCQPEITARRIRVQLSLDASDHYIMGDSARLQQVLWNLLNNSVKFSPEGSAIQVRTTKAGDDAIAVTVADQGRGIDPTSLARIFKPFEQEDKNVASRLGGLGLGLAISKGLVEAHDGEIRAESEGLGRGARFIITLPVTKAPVADLQPALPESGENAPAALRILLVDDHDDTRLIMGRMLSLRGFSVAEAATKAEALAKFRAGTFDLVVSDLGLPDGTGHEMMEIITAEKPIPGIALSGYGMEEDIARSRAAGFRIHLTKPVDFSQLDKAIQEAVAGR